MLSFNEFLAKKEIDEGLGIQMRIMDLLNKFDSKNIDVKYKNGTYIVDLSKSSCHSEDEVHDILSTNFNIQKIGACKLALTVH